MFVAGNPVGDLPFADIEAAAVARKFNTTALLGLEASIDRVIEGLAGADSAHLATHAYFDVADPFASGIVLADDVVLTGREAMQVRLNLRLLVLSACSSGQQTVGASNSLTGLARAFLYAGVERLLVSLWPVNDLSTLLLMNEFYGGLERGIDVAGSLRQAQIWLRNAKAGELADWFARERELRPDDRILTQDQASQAWAYFGQLNADDRPFQLPRYWAPFFVAG